MTEVLTGKDAPIDFGKDKIGALFSKIFFPTLIGMLANTVLTVIDGIFVGRGVGADGIAAVNIVAPLFLLTTGIGLMLGIGSSVLASIRLAENNSIGASRIFTHAVVVGTILVALLCLVCLAFPSGMVRMLGSSARLEPHALDYMLWLVPGLIFLMLECVGMMLIRLDGSPRYAMYCQVVSAALNILLDYVFVFPLGMGVKGAAIATSISIIVGGLMVLYYFLRMSSSLHFVRIPTDSGELRLLGRNLFNISRIGFPTFLSELAMGIMMFTGNLVFMRWLGEEGVAAYAIACYLFPVVFSISNAVAQSAQPIISFNYGAGDAGRVRQALRVALIAAVVSGVVVTVGLFIGSKAVAGAFLSSAEPAYAYAVAGLPLFALCAMPFAINITAIGYYQSIEQAVRPLIYTLLRGLIFMVPAFLFLPDLIGVSGLWLAIPAAELATLLVIAADFFRRHRPH